MRDLREKQAQAAHADASSFNGHFRILDSYRFIAASLVCLYHFNKSDVLGLAKISLIVENIRLGVDFFFILSGFVIAKAYLHIIHERGSFSQFMLRRFARLYPLHLLTLIIGIIGSLAISPQSLQADTNPDIFSARAIIANLTLTHSFGVTSSGTFNSPSWSISAEMFVYLLFPVFALLVTRLPAWVNAGLVVAYITLTILIRDHLGLRDWTLTWYDLGALRAVPTFFTGVLIAHLLSTHWRSFNPPLWWAHTAFLTAAIPMHFDARDEWSLALFALTVLFAAAAEQNGARSLLQRPRFVHLGNASYALYMWHVPVKVGFFAIMGKLFGTGLAPMWSAAILSYVASVTVALLCYRYFELPIRDLIVSTMPLDRRRKNGDRRSNTRDRRLQARPGSIKDRRMSGDRRKAV